MNIADGGQAKISFHITKCLCTTGWWVYPLSAELEAEPVLELGMQVAAVKLLQSENFLDNPLGYRRRPTLRLTHSTN
jgi:hypothetical protein